MGGGGDNGVELQCKLQPSLSVCFEASAAGKSNH